MQLLFWQPGLVSPSFSNKGASPWKESNRRVDEPRVQEGGQEHREMTRNRCVLMEVCQGCKLPSRDDLKELKQPKGMK